LRRFRKTDSVEAEVTSGGRLSQRRHPATGNARSPTVDTVYVGSLAARMTTTGDGDALDLVGKILWRQAVQASVGEHSKLEIDAFRRPKLV